MPRSAASAPSASSTFKFEVGRKRGQAPKAASGPQSASHFWCLTPFPKLKSNVDRELAARQVFVGLTGGRESVQLYFRHSHFRCLKIDAQLAALETLVR